MAHTLNRRRFISITAAAAGLGLVPSSLRANPEFHTVTWSGSALGASATMTVHHHDREQAGLLVKQAVSEVARLEQVFSLYRHDSALAQLNRTGALAAPPPDLVAALEAGRNVWKLSGGAFDPTVQPLWKALAEHFASPDADPAGPPATDMEEALSRVGFDKVIFDQNRIAFGRNGMALTLNGIAQGYITDRVVDVLRHGGIEKSMIDMGEIRAIGSRPDGTPWRVGVEDAGNKQELLAVVDIEDMAVATSSADGFRFDRAGRFNHLLDPRTGLGAGRYRSVAVVAPDATTADALSTAFSLLPPDEVHTMVLDQPGLRAWLSGRGQADTVLTFGSG
ncbi:FAD:protein FMN transferase [Pseudaminobacter sp. 19-2017]|uniref:FAD:protein FMN transferase n=1 Tax=Pseudaminobacter soli (ex Zhang et al. 2022) TaxID=2831468 RepID=A0A942E6Y5_9HYPH|nr:FAD:protein FMN transferase [Pseudaminobacter soli]MBS3651615.1 FAD:protein FMN transferase [Pseudaminobacter soli]